MVRKRFELYVSVLALYISMAVACTTLPAPPIITPPVDGPLTSRVTVVREDRTAVPGLTCEMAPDLGQPIPCDYSSQVRAEFTVPRSLDQTGATLRFSAPDMLPLELRVVIQAELGDYTMYPAFIDLPRLVPVGEYFRTADNQPITIIEASDFNLLARYEAGDNIDPVLQQRHEVGFNLLRIFTAFNVCPTGEGCQKIGRLFPAAFTYTNSIPGLIRKMSLYYLYGEFVGFTGPYDTFFANDDAKVQHWEQLVSTLDGKAALLEMVNEYNNSANANIPYARLRRPTGTVTSHGSATQDTMPLQELWDYATYRPGGGGEWVRKVGHNAWEDVASWAHIPTTSNETTRFPDQDNNPDHAFDAAAGATLMNAGAAFHSVHGKSSELWDGMELLAARAWVAGARSVPLSCQGQPYRHLDDGPYLRVYQRGSDPACIVRIRK